MLEHGWSHLGLLARHDLDGASTPLRALRSVWAGAHRPVPRGTFDAVIVAGARIRDDGTPCPALRRRVRKGVELWRAGLAPVIVMSGRGSGPSPEAPLMADLARARGVPDAALLQESASMSTVENAAFCARDFDFERVAVVSCPPHVHRCELLFSRHFDVVAGVPASWGPARASAAFLVRESALAVWWR